MMAKSPVRMPEMGEESGFLREKEPSILRSGSAPPAAVGSMNAAASSTGCVLNLSEEELRSDPAYSSYYYSRANLNPRLPPPILSREDWRSTQRLGVIGSRDKEVDHSGGEWGDGLLSMAGVFQDELGQTSSIPDYSSGPGRNLQTVVGLQNKSSQAFASVLAPSSSRNTITDSHQVARTPVRSFLNAGVHPSVLNNRINATSDLVDSDDLLAALSGMNLSSSIDLEQILQSKQQQEYLRNTQNYATQSPFSQSSRSSFSNLLESSYLDSAKSNLLLGSDGLLNSYMEVPLAPLRACSSSSAQYQKADSTNATLSSYGLSEYSIDPLSQQMMANQIGTGNLPPLFENAAAVSALAALGIDSRALGGGLSSGLSLNGSPGLQNPNRIGNLSPFELQYIQYLKMVEYGARGLREPSMERGYINTYQDLLGMQGSYSSGLLQHQNQYDTQFLGRLGASNHGKFGNSAFGVNTSYPGSPIASPVLASPVGQGWAGLNSFSGGRMGPWNLDLNENLEGVFPSTLLEEFKSTKTRCFELTDIAGHVVEFSADQYGSRFIQQKLETATTAEKNMVFEQIMPQALSLMTDVFGNYVIQKFFEHGSAVQIRELANELNGHVLALSLQMYGCRVIQKAIEVVDLDQKTKMVTELDGHIMQCVRDQNGNHVIQKCIECIPHEAIQFIISSFYDQVVMLSTHPYGCRVMQRVLEHCDDPRTQHIVMHEIMQCVCMLAQDQYGNYVVQHVLEHGKPHERSEIIKKLAGQIVPMSQQKFASNVVEKCLTFGGPVERQILVNEILGSTDENEPLQAMMKDQFANYVVQKVLETCDDQQRELILSRIKVHLNALKKYTYGKHIVVRVEKLVAAGERRLGLQFSHSSQMAL